MSTKHAWLVGLLFLGSLAHAKDWEASTGPEKLIEFMGGNITGKHFVSEPVSGTSDDETFAYEYSKTIAFASLGEYEHGVKFAIQSLIKQTNTRAHDGLVLNKDRAIVFKCEIGELQSTKELLGFCRTDIAGATDPVGEIYSLTVKSLTPEKLTLKMKQVHYSDANPTGEKLVPRAAASDIAISVKDGLATIDETVSLFDMEAKGKSFKKAAKASEQVTVKLSEARRD